MAQFCSLCDGCEVAETIGLYRYPDHCAVSPSGIFHLDDAARRVALLYEDSDADEGSSSVGFRGEMISYVPHRTRFALVDAFTDAVLLWSTFSGRGGMYVSGEDVYGDAVRCTFAADENVVRASVPKRALPHIFRDVCGGKRVANSFAVYSPAVSGE